MSGSYRRRGRNRKHSGESLTRRQAGTHCTKRGLGQEAAEAEVRYHALMREHGHPQFRVVRAYDCPYCPRWHTTSEPDRFADDKETHADAPE